jgi:outer membrane receptor protein involved in Fe transport
MTVPGWSQEVKTVRDVGVWAGIGIQYRFNKKWQAGFTQEARFFDNAGKLKRLISDIDLTYKINDQFKLGAGVRYAYARKKDNLFTDDVRYNFDFMYRLELSEKIDLKYRFRFQNTFINLSSYYDEFTRKAHARNQLEMQYEHRDHTFYCNAELFREFVIYRRPYFNALRMSIGDQIRTKSGALDYSVNYARELNDPYPLNFFFLRLGYTFKFRHE